MEGCHAAPPWEMDHRHGRNAACLVLDTPRTHTGDHYMKLPSQSEHALDGSGITRAWAPQCALAFRVTRTTHKSKVNSFIGKPCGQV